MCEVRINKHLFNVHFVYGSMQNSAGLLVLNGKL